MVTHSADKTVFIHSLLNYKANAIRLVKLLPRSRLSDPVQCTLIIEDLHPGVEFHALSYVWGPPSHNKILIDGYSFEVRNNLYHFLKEKSLDRDFCLHKRFWVDQICINQENVKERNHQVNQMAQIYSSARRVHIWLGRERGASDGVMDDIQIYKSPYRLPNGLQCRLSPDHEDAMSMGLQCFAYLSEAQYWNRLWIIQEILLAKSISVMCGSRTIPWSQLEVLLNDILQYLKNAQKPVDDIVYAESLRSSNLGRFILERQKMLSEGVYGAARLFDWYNIIQLSRESCCTDVRDRVFGVLGLVDPSFRIPVDYSLSTERICREVLATYARHYLDSGPATNAIASSLDRKRTLEGFAEALVTALGCSDLMTIESRKIIEKEIWRSNGRLLLLLGLPGLQNVVARARRLRREERQTRQRRHTEEEEVIDEDVAIEQEAVSIEHATPREVPSRRSSISYSFSDMSRESPIQTRVNVPTITVTS